MTVYLLDVNLLLALSDPMHIHHQIAHQWFAAVGRPAWATCPLTENGFVRIASNPKYPNRPGDAPIILEILRRFCAAEGHHFWSEDVSLRDLLSPDVILTHGQITDIYLLGLAMHKHGKLATLDTKIPITVIPGSAAALEIIRA